MKKNLFLLITIMIIVVIIIFVKCKSLETQRLYINKFNLEYEEYNKNDLNGLDITTIINKATSNNEKYEIEKDENGLYILDDMYSIEIYVILEKDSENTYRMESINKANMSDFVRYFGNVGFECIDLKYHPNNGRISSMTFEAKEY